MGVALTGVQARSPASTPTWWAVGVYTVALILAVAIGYFLFRMPFQVTDNMGNLLSVRVATLWEILQSQFGQKAFLRPFLWANLKIVFDAAGGRYFEAFRAFQAAQVLATVLLCVRLFRVRAAPDFAAGCFALTVLLGSHTFGGMIREAYPINTFLSIVVYCLAAANLSVSRPRWWVDLTALLLFAVAALTLETGLLVWVCVAAGYVVGFRGVSRRGLALVTASMAGYFLLRFGVLDTGAPGLIERSTGYGFGVVERDALTARFGAAPLPFYAYNVVSSFVGVLLAEPRGGVWELTRNLWTGERVPPWMVINVLSSAIVTLLIAAVIATRLRDWLRARLEDEDRLMLVFLAVLAANATISFPYTKDIVMSPAGAFYAVAAYYAVRRVLRAGVLQQSVLARVAVATLLLVASSLWTIRVVGLGYNMRYTAFTNRSDWAEAMTWFQDQPESLKTPDARRFIEEFQNKSIRMPLGSPHFMQPYAEPYFDQH